MLEPEGPAQWVATDTWEPFVWRGDGWEIDLREMVRNRTN